MSAMLMSVMMRSYGPRGRRRMASKPLLASTTSQPPCGRRELGRLEHGADERAGRGGVLDDQDPAHATSLKAYYEPNGASAPKSG